MFSLTILTTLLLQLTAICLATPTPALSTRSTATCSFVSSYPNVPSCPGGCCGWLFPQGSTGGYCTTTSSSTISLSSKPANWLASCTALKQSLLASAADYVVITYQQNAYQVLASNSGCSFEASIGAATDPSDPMHIGTADVVALLTSAITTTQNGNFGAAGSTSCWAYAVQWKVVPPGN